MICLTLVIVLIVLVVIMSLKRITGTRVTDNTLQSNLIKKPDYFYEAIEPVNGFMMKAYFLPDGEMIDGTEEVVGVCPCEEK